MPANAAIHFEPDGYSTSGPKLMGRQAAGEGFLRAWMRHAEIPALLCQVRSEAHAARFAALRDAHAQRALPVRGIRAGDVAALAEAGTLYLPDPGLPAHAWRRRRLGAAHRYSLCGVTHTIASQGVMDSIAGYLRAPVEPWDALICTSQVVLDAVHRLLEAERQWLAERLGAAPAPALPELALIPLGVECERYAPDAGRRARWRRELGAGAEDVVFLFVGRLSYHAKANPMPMYLALEEAARRSRRRLHLVQAGWFHNDSIRQAFVRGAAALCPSVKMQFLDGRDPRVRDGVRYGADVFISLSDNVQETFGLTPAEAMAAGLPCIVSDWDGYRDTVRDGVDGMRVPTLAPPPGAGAELAARHEDGIDTYDRYIGHASLATSVDPQASAEACTALASDAGLRRRMGEAALRRAREEFDWRAIVRRYQALWDALAERRAGARIAPPLADPRRRDPFWLFAEYPSRTLAGRNRLVAAPEASAERLRALHASPLAGFGGAILPRIEVCQEMLSYVAGQPGCSVEALLRAVPAAKPLAQALRGVVWLHKLGLIRLAP